MRLVHRFAVDGTTIEVTATHSKRDDGTEELETDVTRDGQPFSIRTLCSSNEIM
ncbi:hypothetical protein R3Q06_11245 [Rhodococcus erythropolis]|uniref:hypothetical protein n=1 Tax=Rhodococcus erythropolis TaxID=1833 RepID=UPI00294A483B|nr:hypothetical protein [Rhodococcus erythropolis]MDV6274075.1 hypothetical protein [Rhodococcus erythropolis]